MTWLNNNLAGFLAFLGLALLALEIIVLGFSTFVLFFIGLASVFTGSLMFLGVLPETLVSGVLSVGILTGVLSVALWKPLKKFQNKVVITTPKSDLIGLSFALGSDVSPTLNSSHAYSGIEWKVASDEDLPAGTEVEVIKVDVGIFTVAEKA